MSRDYRAYLDDILQSTEKIAKYVQPLEDFEAFRVDDLRIDAIARNLEIIGEAASHIPLEIRDKYPEVEWRNIIGFRNIMVHEYFNVDLRIVWDILRVSLPQLKAQIQLILENEQSNDLNDTP